MVSQKVTVNNPSGLPEIYVILRYNTSPIFHLIIRVGMPMPRVY